MHINSADKYTIKKHKSTFPQEQKRYIFKLQNISLKCRQNSEMLKTETMKRIYNFGKEKDYEKDY